MEEIKTILLNVQDTVIKLQKGQEEMRQDIQGIKKEQEEMKQDIQGIQQEQSTMKEDIAEIKGKLNVIDEAQNIIVKEIYRMQEKNAPTMNV